MVEESIDGLIDKDRFMEEMYEQESWTSSASYKSLMICPSLRSYSSLQQLSCRNKNEEECRLVNLNNVIKKLFDTIDDPFKKQEVSFICCLLAKFLKYNGNDGFYAKHLPQIGEILEFLSMEAKKFNQYLNYLHHLLDLCCKPLLLQHTSELFDISSKLQRYFSLLGYLLVLAPTKLSFFSVKLAIENLVCENTSSLRHDVVKPDVRREAMEQSRLPITLTELTEVASTETYPAVLQLIFTLTSVSTISCHRMLEAGIETRILMRLQPAYKCGCECEPLVDDDNLLCDKVDYIETTECATKILSCLTASLFIATNGLSNECCCFEEMTSPSRQAMWSLRAALRRELLRAGYGSSSSRKLRNELANLILAGLVRCWAKWQIADTGIIDDLLEFFVATEYEIVDGWATGVKVEVDNVTGLDFKKTLLAILARIAEFMPKCAETFRNKNIVSGLLQLIEPNNKNATSTAKISWNSEQLWHLFKYAANALTYLAPKIPDEFIECHGTLRLLSLLRQFIKTTDNDYDDALVTSFAEMICSLSLANCDTIMKNFRECDGFILVLFEMIRRVLNFEALALKHQRVIAYLLVAAENILSDEECFCDSTIKLTTDLFHRCLHQKVEDSKLDQSFLIAIGTFACKCVIHCLGAQKNFLTTGGLYQTLDLIEQVNLPIQNLYLSLLTDVCENKQSRRYLFSWKCRGDRRNGILSLLANIWREEERNFGVERSHRGCIINTEAPLLNDEQWVYVSYLKSACEVDVLTTTSVGSVRPKIHYLLGLIQKYCEEYKKGYFEKMFEELSAEDQVTIIAVNSYTELKSDEASLEVLSSLKIRPLTKSRKPLLDPTSKLDLWSTRSRMVRQHQEKLLQKSQTEEEQYEQQILEKIQHTNLSPEFDMLSKLADSVRSCKLQKMREAMMKENKDGVVRKGPCFETCDFGEGEFEKDVVVQSIQEESSDDDSTVDDEEQPSVSMSTVSDDFSRCSVATDDSQESENFELRCN